jgi:hypothetical protein
MAKETDIMSRESSLLSLSMKTKTNQIEKAYKLFKKLMDSTSSIKRAAYLACREYNLEPNCAEVLIDTWKS